MREQLSDHEIRLLRDFLQRRPRRLAPFNAALGVLAAVSVLILRPSEAAVIVIGILAGVLVGVYFEQRHVAHLRQILMKLSSDYLERKP